MSKPSYYLGLMSGTSIDSIDAALVAIDDNTIKLIGSHNEPIPYKIKQEIINLSSPGFDAINKLGALDTKLGRLFSDAALNLLSLTNISPTQITAIGSHGQTIRHNPNKEHPFTIQIADPNIIASHTKITTVADFRRRDLAHSGQGAPLTPAFHQFMLKHLHDLQWVLNIGGISNVTLLDNNKIIAGFDTGPGNILLDSWCHKHLNQPYDKDGEWAAKGTVIPQLLDLLLADLFFLKTPPKSTGREHFNLNWLEKIIKKMPCEPEAKDIQATLIELTAQSIADAITCYNNTPTSIRVCGGGAYNKQLMKRLSSLCPHYNIKTTDDLNIAPEWVEACAFAWLAKQTIEKVKINLQDITGATQESILGGIYLA